MKHFISGLTRLSWDGSIESQIACYGISEYEESLRAL